MKKSAVSLLSATMGVLVGMGITGNFMDKLIKKNSEMSEKHLALFLMMNQWVKVKQEGKNLTDFFERNGKGCNAVVGISGGKDSSVVAALCVEALGRERVIGVLMPQGVQPDIEAAYL